MATRREFLKDASNLSLLAGTMLLSGENGFAGAPARGRTNATWDRYNFSKPLTSLTEAAKAIPAREELLENALRNIPSEDRVKQIHDTVITHLIAEETADVDLTMSTLVEKPIYEDIASGKTIVGHQDVMDDYRKKYESFPAMTRHLTNFMVDKNGCFVELLWEGKQEGPIQGITPPKNRPKIYLPVTVYFQVNEMGKISRETVYYDQYLMFLNLDLIPDIANKPLVLALLNPGLIGRRDK
jgi:hypothetical protein